MAVKITDLVDPTAIEQLDKLNTTLSNTLVNFTEVAKQMAAQSIKIKIETTADLDKTQETLIQKNKEASEAASKLNDVLGKQSQVLAATTNTTSRMLMEQERLNKQTRETYTDSDKFKALMERVNGSYENRVKRLVEVENEIKDAKTREKELNDEMSKGHLSQKVYTEAMTELRMHTRELITEKQNLNLHLRNEEKEMQSVEGSYNNLSQRLDLMRRAYKNLTEEELNQPMGKEMERAIQDLDAHLKDMAADMGEFQRNVGNYAIAGQQGVASTESVVAAMNQEARTTQDLVDQTKILEEAKRMLDTNDAKYAETLASLNEKIDENKRKLTDVSDILGKEATSVAEAEAQNKRLSEAMKHIDLTSADAKKKLEEMRAQIERNNSTIASATGQNEQFADSLLSMVGINMNLGSSFQTLGQSGNFLQGMTTKVQALGKTLMGLLSNPWVLSFLGLAGIAAGFKWWYDFNKGLIEASRLTENFTGLTGDAADKITADFGALADRMGKGYDETIGAANTLVQQFGISWDDALTLMKDGLQAGADYSGNMVGNIDRFAPALRDAGVGADEFVAILAETRNGIFSEKGVQDILKGGTRLRAMTKNMAESLDAVGISSQQMQKDLADGNITMMEAVQQVAGKLKELPENSQEAGKLMKEVFGRTAAEGGRKLIESIADVCTNLEEQKKKTGELGEVNREQMEAQQELQETLMAVFKMSGTSFEQLTTKAKTLVAKGLTAIIKGCVDIANWFIRMYNESLLFRTGVEYIVFAFKQVWEAAKFLFNYLIEGFKNAGKMLESIFTFDFSSPVESFKKIMATVKEGYSALGKQWKNFLSNSVNNFNAALDNIENNKIKEISVKLDQTAPPSPPGTNGNGTGTGNGDKNGTGNGDKKGKGNKNKSDKEAEKRAKEELKLIQELEDGKIALMEDGHEKELALIRQKYKKKFDEIKGHSQTEEALRIQLAEQCEKEVSDCELKYQTELAKINFENRLATVEKGSKEELDLKLAQIEKSRDVELEAAKKNGADVDLINKKFDKQRLDAIDDFNQKCLEKIQKRYADEAEERDNAMMQEMLDAEQQYAEQLKAAGKNDAKREAAHQEYEARQADITERYAIKSAQAAVDMLKESLEQENLSAEDREKIQRDLCKAKMELEQAETDHEIEQMKRRDQKDKEMMEKRKERISNWLGISSDAISAISELTNALFDREISRIDEQMEANEAAGDEEQERISSLVEQKVITEEEGEARKRAAQSKTARQQQELEKKKAALQRKQAIFQKAVDLAQAGIATALAITQALPNVVMAAIVGALGAVQIATILATPIPKYAHGTDYHQGGPAIVGDGGRHELVLFNNSAWITPDKPTFVDIPTGAAVLPQINIMDSVRPLPYVEQPQQQVVLRSDFTKFERSMMRAISELASLIKQQTKVQRSIAYDAAFERYKNSK